MNAASLLAVFAAITCAAGQVLLNPPTNPSVISVDVRLVNVVCSVRDRNGAFVKDLVKDDFEVREDGRPRDIRHFSRESDSPLTVALLLDVSGSVARLIETEKATAARFFAEVLRPGDKAMLTGFAQWIAVWQDLTGSLQRLNAALDRAGPMFIRRELAKGANPRGGTLLWDAVTLVSEQKLKRQPGRKAMVIISDGLDNGSIATQDSACRSAQEADTVVYAIHYQDEWNSGGRSGRPALQKLSEPTGGQTFRAGGKTKLETILDTIGKEMRSQYSLGYTPPEGADGFRRLEVKVRKAGLKAQARKGYYAGGR